MSAVFSSCGNHRLRLDREVPYDLSLLHAGRVFDEDARYVFCGVNPSVAGDVKNDPTITKVTGFCQRWGVGQFTMVNVFTRVSTDVKQLAKLDPLQLVARMHMRHLEEALEGADAIIPCWGARGKLPKALHNGLDNRLEFLRFYSRRHRVPLYHFGLTTSGDPGHPLMLAYTTPLTEF